MSGHSGSGSQNPRPNFPSQDPRCKQLESSSNPSRAENATGYTNISHPTPSPGIESLPPRPATGVKESRPRNAAPNYGFYRDSTLSSSTHISPRQSLAATNEPLKVTATKTSLKPSFASKSFGPIRTNDDTGGGSGAGGGATGSLSQATPPRSRFQPHKIAGPGSARLSPASGRIVSMDSISRSGVVYPENPLSRYALTAKGSSSGKSITQSIFAAKSNRSTTNSQPAPSTPQKSLNRPAPRIPPSQTTSAQANITPSKSSKPLGPLWQEQDAEFQHFLALKKRDREGHMITAAKRVTSIPGRRGFGAARSDVIATLSVDDPDRTMAQIAPNLKLHVDGKPTAAGEDEDEDGPRYRPQARAMLGKKIARNQPQIAAKSRARKVEYVDTSSESSSNSSDSTMSESEQAESEIDELQFDSDAERLSAAGDDGDVVMADASKEPPTFRSPAIFLLDRPTESVAPVVPSKKDSKVPSDQLVAAVEALTLSSIRMQKTSQLPFLLRNLRHGFLLRCRRLQVPVYTDGRDLSFSVQYSYLDDAVYRVDGLSVWLCPLCNLLGALKTREMLDCHLRWDHPEVYCEWRGIDETPEKEIWQLQILVPEIGGGIGNEETEARPITLPTQSDEQPNSLEVQAGTQDVLQTPSNRSFSSPFPSVSLSPPSVRRGVVQPQTPITPSIRITKAEPKREDWASNASITTSQRPTPAGTSSRGRSSVAGSSTTATGTPLNIPSLSTSAAATPHPGSSTARNGCHPDPPPASNPLGPAAQFPYLPAESEYGGPTVYYSCRPSGPCLFDLLGTLPLEPFGILDWQILDVEDEIYEVDDVREEYKVMHALWARWIFLNRNKLISNYLKGVIAFVDDYWKMIHRAAGWDALRYWCWLLLANKILTGRDVAKVLVHYEELTGMANWYDE